MTNAQKKLRDLRHDAPSSFFMDAIIEVIAETECEVERAKLKTVFWAFSMIAHFRCERDRGVDSLEDASYYGSLRSVLYHAEQAQKLANASQEPANS